MQYIKFTFVHKLNTSRRACICSHKRTRHTHTIRKVKFLSKNSILTKLYNFLGKSKLSTTKKCKSSTFSRVFHLNFFLTIFLVKSKLSTAKKSKSTTISRVLHPKNREFSREIKVELLKKK